MAALVETMAYNKVELPWHGFGFPVDNTLTAKQMQKASKTNWSVEKVPAFITVGDKQVSIGRDALVRSSDQRILDIVTPEWKPVQNDTAFEFFHEFVTAGDMEMETAGSLRRGQIVWALAKIKDSFELFGGRDKIDSYMLFTNPFKWGWATSVSFTPIRVVCMNTLCLSLGSTKGDKIVRVNHRNEFDPSEVKEILGLAKEKLKKYEDVSRLLAGKKAKPTDVVDYFKELFPVITAKADSTKELSKGAAQCVEHLVTQPGGELGAGTWWAAYNSVTYYADHLAGRNADNRLASAWYGINRRLKLNALKKAAAYAEAS